MSSSNTGNDEDSMLPSPFDKDLLLSKICLLICSAKEPGAGTRELRDVILRSISFAWPLGFNRPYPFS